MGSVGNQYGLPAVPNAPTYQNDPSKYQGFDTTGLSQAAIANSNQAGSNQIAQAKAQAAGMGGGRSSSANNAVMGIQSGLGQNAQNIYNQNAQKSFEQQLAQMQNQNQFNLGSQANQNALYGTQANANIAQQNTNVAQQQQGLQTAMMLAALMA